MSRTEILKAISKNESTLRAFQVKRLLLFGSAAREELRAASDLDFLVEFIDLATFDNFMGLKLYLEELLGCSVDLVTQKALRSALRPAVERDALPIYVA